MSKTDDPRMAVVLEALEVAHDNHPAEHPAIARDLLARLDEGAFAIEIDRDRPNRLRAKVWTGPGLVEVYAYDDEPDSITENRLNMALAAAAGHRRLLGQRRVEEREQ